MDRQSEKPIGSKNGQDFYQTYIGQSRYTETNMNLLWCITMEKQSFLIKKKKKRRRRQKKSRVESRALATNYEKLSIKPIVNPLIFLFILTRKGLKKNYRPSYRNQ